MLFAQTSESAFHSILNKQYHWAGRPIDASQRYSTVISSVHCRETYHFPFGTKSVSYQFLSGAWDFNFFSPLFISPRSNYQHRISAQMNECFFRFFFLVSHIISAQLASLADCYCWPLSNWVCTVCFFLSLFLSSFPLFCSHIFTRHAKVRCRTLLEKWNCSPLRRATRSSVILVWILERTRNGAPSDMRTLIMRIHSDVVTVSCGCHNWRQKRIERSERGVHAPADI